MSQATCTRCGRPLRNGVCPRGHPQRAARRRARPKRGRKLLVALLILALLAGAAWGAFRWYPERAAAQLLRGPSETFASTADAYNAAVHAFPTQPTAETLETQVSASVTTSARARPALADLQGRIEARDPVTIPVVRNRDPLPLAHRVRARMLDFAIGGLELIADMEGVSTYLQEAAPLLETADELESELGTPRTPRDVDGSAEAVRPVAGRLVSELGALTPPPELTATHESARAIAERIQADLTELDDVTGRGAEPIIRSLAQQIRRQLGSLRETLLSAPEEARDAGGLGARIDHLEAVQERIVRGLLRLRNRSGVAVTVPTV
ncbi:MAG TPA: hypothetical protein VM638_02130 [Actinomycetota bacterium]|nr:hypothetical protein [Actinomycetota bacterium]